MKRNVDAKNVTQVRLPELFDVQTSRTVTFRTGIFGA